MTQTSSRIPKHCDVLIIGGGIIGTSIAYHLAQAGAQDVLLLERSKLTSGTTWHAAGAVGRMRGGRTRTQIASHTVDLYKSLEQDQGLATGFRKTGSLSFALDQDRLLEFHRTASKAEILGEEAEVVSPDRVAELWPGLRTDDILGGLWLPDDGFVNPVDATQALAKGAKAKGAQLLEDVEVFEILIENGRAVGAVHADGQTRANRVILAGGIWTRNIARRIGVHVPLYAAEHYYIVTEPIKGLPPKLPFLRAHPEYTYYKEEMGKLLVGLFEPNARPVRMDDIPKDFSFEGLAGDMDHFMPYLEQAMARIAWLEDAGIQTFFCGPESFTPDGEYYIGPSPSVDALFVVAGFNSHGIQASGGVGKVVSQWVMDGRAPIDMTHYELTRTMPFQSTRHFLEHRIPETLAYSFDVRYPQRTNQTGRGIRKSPLHALHVERRACFGTSAGWERPVWYAAPGEANEHQFSFGAQNWHASCAAECFAARDAVAIIDQSCFTKTRVVGADAERYLDRICTNRIEGAGDRVVYTQILNEWAGIESDITVVREADDAFLIIGAPHTQTRDHWLLSQRRKRDERVSIVDVTSGEMMLSVSGPKARQLLQSLSPDDFSDEGFPFGTSRMVELGGAIVRATRLTYVGELGWELVFGTEYADALARTLLEAGGAFGARLSGFYALSSMRVEKGMRSWPHDIGPLENNLEAGLGFSVAWDKPAFIGRDALMRARDTGKPRKRLVQFRLEDDTAQVFHDDPIYVAGKPVGSVTSAAIGFRSGGSFAMGYVSMPEPITSELLAGTDFEIVVADRKISAKGQFASFYDPKRKRVLS